MEQRQFERPETLGIIILGLPDRLDQLDRDLSELIDADPGLRVIYSRRTSGKLYIHERRL